MRLINTPLLNKHQIPKETKEHVALYFKTKLPQYEPVEITRSSNHPEDNYLYHVIAQNTDTKNYAAWTCWNESTKSLNHGHYDIPSINSAREIVNEYYNDIEPYLDAEEMAL